MLLLKREAGAVDKAVLSFGFSGLAQAKVCSDQAGMLWMGWGGVVDGLGCSLGAHPNPDLIHSMLLA